MPGKSSGSASVYSGGEITLKELSTLGIIAEPKDGFDESRPLGGAYVRFKDRLVCPIVDIKDQVSGFSRLLNDSKKAAKYVNSETPIFIKSEQLYGASTAKKVRQITCGDRLPEGNLDVISLWEFDFKAA